MYHYPLKEQSDNAFHPKYKFSETDKGILNKSEKAIELTDHRYTTKDFITFSKNLQNVPAKLRQCGRNKKLYGCSIAETQNISALEAVPRNDPMRLAPHEM